MGFRAQVDRILAIPDLLGLSAQTNKLPKDSQAEGCHNPASSEFHTPPRPCKRSRVDDDEVRVITNRPCPVLTLHIRRIRAWKIFGRPNEAHTTYLRGRPPARPAYLLRRVVWIKCSILAPSIPTAASHDTLNPIRTISNTPHPPIFRYTCLNPFLPTNHRVQPLNPTAPQPTPHAPLTLVHFTIPTISHKVRNIVQFIVP